MIDFSLGVIRCWYFTFQAGCYGYHGKVLPQRDGGIWVMCVLQPINMAANVPWTEDEGCTMHIITVRQLSWAIMPTPHYNMLTLLYNHILYWQLTAKFVFVALWSRRLDRAASKSLWSLRPAWEKTRINPHPVHHTWLTFWDVQSQWTSVNWVSPCYT